MCSSKFRLHHILLLVLATHIMVGQTFDESRLNAPEYLKPKSRLFHLLQNEKLDSAFLLSAQLLNRSASGLYLAEQSIDANVTVAKVLNKMGSDHLAVQYVRQAISLYEEQGFETSYYLVRLWNLSAAYQHLNKDLATQTISLYRKARRWDVENGHTLVAASSLNNIGLVYLNTNDLDSAEFYFLAAKAEYEEAKLPFNEFAFSLNNNLGQVAYRKKQFARAYNLYFTNYKLADTLVKGIMPIDIEKRKVSSRIGMMQVLLKENNLIPIDTLLERAHSILPHLDFTRSNPLKLELLAIESELQLKKGNLEEFYTLLKEKEDFMDSVAQIRTDNVALFMEELIKLQLQSSKANLKANQNELKYEFRQRTLIYILVIGALISLALTIGLRLSLISKRKQKVEAEKQLAEIALQNTELKEEKLKLQLKNQGQDLGELSSQLLLMRNLNKEIQQKIKHIKALKKDEQLNEVQNLSGLLTRKVSESKVKNLLQQHLDKVNSEFYLKLSNLSAKKLTKAEMEVCAMQRLNMDDTQIAELRGTTQNAVQVARYRIKKKLNLDTDTLLIDFLKNL